MQMLRYKVFKKVKPKELNGRILTGQMFLELCEAYSASINEGQVPSIEGAWTSLCKNENLRRMKQTIENYERLMDDGSYVDKQKTQCIEYAALKKLNKDTTAMVLDQFKEDVFGGQEQIGPCLSKIEEQI